MEEWLQQDVSLLAMTNEVDYDQDGEFHLLFLTIILGGWLVNWKNLPDGIINFNFPAYAQQLEDMIAEKQEALAALREKTIAFRTCLREEELQSKEMNLRK